MKNAIVILALAITIPVISIAQDPAKTDGDKYKVIFENEKVRVLEYKDKPGEKTSLHHHPDFVLYALGSFKRNLFFPSGKRMVREFKKGDMIWMNDQFA